MSRLRHLVQEIHRRSLWQVLGVFLAASWGVLNAVDFLTSFAGLPDWTPTMALVLLMIGLPIVMATAVVQEGLPGQSDTDAGGPSDGAKPDDRANPDDGANPDESAKPGRSAPTRMSPSPDGEQGVTRLLTWKNAIVGGGLAAALLLTAAGGYLAMWALGIGPVGSLAAQGVLDARDPIVVARFDSRSDPSLGEIVSEALSVDLGQSQAVTLLSRDAVRSTLQLMGRDPNDPVTTEAAREIAVRENLKAYVAGDVSQVGTRYLLVARIVGSEDGADLVSFREEAAGDDDLLPAIDRLSTKLREKMGESLRSIRLGTPLEQATTSSLDALRKLTEAERAEERGEYERANRLLEEAVALDPAFAQAHRKMAVLRYNVGAPREQIIEASRKAYENRDRLTERERYLVEANYHTSVTQDRDAVIRAYESALALNPDESAALNNLANVYRERGQDHEAKELLERALGGAGASSVAANNLTVVNLNLGDVDAARAALQSYEERYPGHIYAGSLRFQLAAFLGDRVAVHEGTDAMSRDPNLAFFHPDIPSFRIAADVEDGKVREAIAHGDELESGAISVGTLVRRRNAALGAGDVYLWILDDSTRAVSATTELIRRIGLSDDPLERGWEYAVSTLALAGGLDAAEALFSDRTSDTDAHPASRAIAEGMIRYGKGDFASALSAVDEAAAILRCTRCVEMERALVLEALDRTQEAIDIWERVRATPLQVTGAGWERIIAIKRLGPLYEKAGDSASAREAHQALVDAWTEADPELQPQVDAARARITALGG